jgi:hypothetical protein
VDYAEHSLDATKATLGGLAKHGVSVSTDPKGASRYATDFYPNSPVVRSLTATPQKPLNLDARDFEKLQGLVGKIDRGEPLTELEDVGLEMLLKKVGVPYVGHPIDAIKAAGYDAIDKTPRAGSLAEPETLFFDPKALTTKWGGK